MILILSILCRTSFLKCTKWSTCETCSKYNHIKLNWWIFKKNYNDLNFIMNSRNLKKNPSSKYLRSWSLRSKLYLVSCFYTSLLMITFEDLILIFYISIPNLTIEVIMKKKIKQHFATTYRHLTKKIMAFVYWSMFLVHFTMLAPS